MTTHIADCEGKIAVLDPENEKLKSDIEIVREQMKRTVTEASEEAAEEVRCIKVNFLIPKYIFRVFNDIFLFVV